MRITGLVPILATPFTAEGDLDLEGMRSLAEFQLDARADAVAAFALTSEERERILRETCRVTAGAIPVIAGVNATSARTALEQARRAADGGAVALMVLPPYLVKPSAAQIVEFYGEVAEGSGLPIMVQDAPGATGVAMSVALLAELGSVTGVWSAKVEAQPTASKVADVTAVAPELPVFGGQNAFFVLEEYAAGAVGTMPAAEFTDALREVLVAWESGDLLAAHALFNRLLPLVRFGLQPGLAHAVHKEVMVRRGIIRDATVRSPARALDRTARAALDTILQMAQLPAWRKDAVTI
jgi:2-keto-3-deoxy-L-arabinonate dehydratase